MVAATQVPKWALIVEGHGEVRAVPALLRHWFPEVALVAPLRVPRGVLLGSSSELERYLLLARRQADAVVVLLDSDDEDPDVLERELGTRVRTYCADRPTRVCTAVREFEAWFLCAASALALGEDVPNAQDIRDAKGLVRARDGAYRPVAHQARYAARLAAAYASLADAQRAPSLRRFHDALRSLV